jgi:FkbM family methyltransferase
MMRRINNKINSYVYKYYKKRIQRFTYDAAALQTEGYYSQCGQDKFIVEKLLNGLTNGVFVEVGANDGVTFSNTYYMEKNLGWTGVAVEPLPRAFRELSANRKCNVLNGCVSDFNGDVQFLALEGYTEMLSGIANKYDGQHLERIERELKVHGGEKTSITVPCFTLEKIVADYKLAKVDYLSIDTEGGELEIIESLKNGKVNVSVISVENNYSGWRIFNSVRRLGYKLVAEVGSDEIYQKV